MYQLAQLNIAKAKYPLDDPAISEFVDNLEPINALADAAAGFIWRLQGESGDATDISIYDDYSIVVNMSVWDGVESLKQFAYRSRHADFVKRKKEWFERLEASYYVLWWVPAGHQPDMEEARERLEYLRANGESQRAFTFRKIFEPA